MPERSAVREYLDLAALALDVKAVLDARVWSSGVMYGARACIDCPSRREPGVSTETPGFRSAAR